MIPPVSLPLKGGTVLHEASSTPDPSSSNNARMKVPPRESQVGRDLSRNRCTAEATPVQIVPGLASGLPEPACARPDGPVGFGRHTGVAPLHLCLALGRDRVALRRRGARLEGFENHLAVTRAGARPAARIDPDQLDPGWHPE